MSEYDFGWTDARMSGGQSPTPDALARKIVGGKLSGAERKLYLREISRHDVYMASAGAEGYGSFPDEKIYRVSIFPDGVDVICLGLDSVDSTLEGHYDHVDDLPDWVKERIAVLSMMSATPPTKVIEGIGRRISKSVYWVFPQDTASASTSA